MKTLVISFFVFSIPIEAQNYSWVRQATLGSLLSVLDFVDLQHGWAAYGSNAIYRTTDGGVTWTPYGGNVGFIVYGISFADSLNGWCAGTDGTDGLIIHTTDGGKTWVPQLDMPYRKYFSTQALSKDKNITCGQTKYSSSSIDTGRIVTTTDGGKTWVERTIRDSITQLNKVQFVDSLYGWIIVDLGSGILRTTNGGVTWSINPAPGLNAMFFLSRSFGYACSGGYFFKTSDSGLSWTQLAEILLPDNTDYLHSENISFLDTLYGWGFGSVFHQGVIVGAIFRTTNGGATWGLNFLGNGYNEDIYEGAMIDRSHGWAVETGSYDSVAGTQGRLLSYKVVTGVSEKLPQLPFTFALQQNYPNPFNPTTTIEYSIPIDALVTLKIFDVLGNKVATLVDQKQIAGLHYVTFDGNSLASGVYFYRLQTAAYFVVKKLVLLK